MSLDADYYNQTCQVQSGVFTYFSGLSGTGGLHTLTLLRSDFPATNHLALPIPPATFVLKIVASAPTGHTDCTGTVTVNAEAIAFTGAATKYSVTGLTATPTIYATDLDCNLVITAYDTTDVYYWASSPCRWKADAIMFIASGGTTFTQSKAVIITDAVYTVGQTLRLVGGSDVYGQLVKMITVQLNIDGVIEASTYFI